MGRLARAGVVEVIVDADPAAVWAVVADPTRVGEWSHETRGASWIGGATAAAPGARFVGRNRVGSVRWARQNEVLAVEAPRRISWRTVPSWRFPDSTEWSIEVAPADAGTRITQRFEILRLGAVLDRVFWLLIPSHRDRRPALAADLRRIGDLAARTPAH